MRPVRSTPLTLIIIQTLLELLIFQYFASSLNFSSLSGAFSILWVFGYLYIAVAFTTSSFASPGYVSSNWTEEAGLQSSQSTDETPPFCEKCNIERPLRSHHCSKCGRCVHVMDHHCIFTDNCVGTRTFKPFFLFLCVFPFHALHTMIIAVSSLGSGKFSAIKMLIMMANIMYFITTTIFVIIELQAQIGLLRRNSTWIEKKEKHARRAEYKEAGVPLVDEFDTGSLIANVKARFGSRFWLWLLPVPNQEIVYIFERNPRYTPPHMLQT